LVPLGQERQGLCTLLHVSEAFQKSWLLVLATSLAVFTYFRTASTDEARMMKKGKKCNEKGEKPRDIF
jgi:hypothetical protein